MTACSDWKDRLLDSVLDGSVSNEVEKHLIACAACSAAFAELRALREQMDSGLRELIRAAEPSPAFHARLRGALDARPAQLSRWPALAGILATVALAVLVGVFLVPLNKWRKRMSEPAQVSVSEPVLSQWRSPTEALLQSPADKFLRSGPRLGQFYFPLKPVSVRSNAQRRWRKL